MVSRQQLAVFLSKLKVFESPNINLEQYPTDSEIAATILWDAYMQGEIEGKTVADLGCGTGILGIGALALGAAHVIFIDIDSKVLPTLMENIAAFEEKFGECSRYEIIHGNIQHYDRSVDTVLQNPPFGTQEKHADVFFLEKAIALAPVVYSLHKTSTEEFLHSWADRHNVQISKVMRFTFPLKQAMKQHLKKVHHIEVSCLKIVVFGK